MREGIHGLAITASKTVASKKGNADAYVMIHDRGDPNSFSLRPKGQPACVLKSDQDQCISDIDGK